MGMTGHALKVVRAAVGMTQEDLARALGCSQQLVGRMESRGHQPLRPGHQARIQGLFRQPLGADRATDANRSQEVA